MKLSFSIAMALCLFIQIFGVLSAVTPATDVDISGRSPLPQGVALDRSDPIIRAQLKAECGDLGVMEVPEGANPAKVRHCAGHPAGGKSINPVRPGDEVFHTQQCWRWAVRGACDESGYCWKTCGKKNPIDERSWQWCWLAGEEDGSGPWIGCKWHEDCNEWNQRRNGCSSGNCKACGCSC